jgi:hypothetical protein
MNDSDTLQSLSRESLEDEIATLSATLAAATYRLLLLVGELDRRGVPDDCRSSAHWLSWRVGLSLGVARQYVRVAKALPELPKISEAFGRGELSFSKVRAITRIATPALEDDLLAWARAGTASHVETLVRRFRKANREEENDQALTQRDRRGLRTYWSDDGTLVIEARLTPEQGGVTMEALSDGGFRFVRPDGTVVVAAPPLPVAAWAQVSQFVPRGVDLRPETNRPSWEGERPDYEWMGWCLQSGVET